jgi:hypothetical protein
MTTIEDFDNYLDECRICGDSMNLNARFDIFTHSQDEFDNFSFSCAGAVVFDFVGRNRFVKIDSIDFDQKGIAQIAHDATIKSFTLGKRTYPNLKRYKIALSLPKDLKLDSITMSIHKECFNSKHYFGYETELINEFDNGMPDLLSVSQEYLNIHNHTISTLIKDNQPIQTEVRDLRPNHEIRTIPKNERIILPPIPFDVWNEQDEQAFHQQLRKFSMLL